MSNTQIFTSKNIKAMNPVPGNPAQGEVNHTRSFHRRFQNITQKKVVQEISLWRQEPVHQKGA